MLASGLSAQDPAQLGEYRVLARLGSGGQGVVYLAEAPSGRRVAVKQLHPGPFAAKPREQLAREIAAARRVPPFCTARVLDADLHGASPYIVSEYIEGPSLQQRVSQEGPLAGTGLHWLALGTATALAAIHQAGVVHRDFKPSNVMLSPDGPRVIDFGVAYEQMPELADLDEVAGTPAYMAPEQIRGGPVSPAADVFAWASVIAYAATGLPPFQGEHVGDVLQRILEGEPDLRGVPPELAELLHTCLDQYPARRPGSQQVLMRLLGHRVTDEVPDDVGRLVATAAGMVDEATLTTPIRPAAATTTAVGVPAYGGPDIGGRRSARPLVVVAVGLLLAGAFWMVNPFDDLASSPESLVRAENPPAEPAPDPEPERKPAPVAAGEVPSGFSGEWRGTAYQPAASQNQWELRLDLAAGTGGGQVRLEELACSGRATVSKVADLELRLNVVIEDDPDHACPEEASLRVTQNVVGRAAFWWNDGGNPFKVATGMLVKQ
ncbi:serine/threonine-protein kinase [Kineosporia babensis]|uniref:Serine/threonine protein kinase n=1 Tax=Kineosporia babensis TaxID=499548 RepID=A0A9X1SXY9_9ACTN|nr:serine/threonine-protein kinase [Kineosporia babensis]MCD5316511.1 serine/threonine protein kinase [Kineosporia babensis]